ncbi:MAG: polyprenyl synthetase family protein [Lachnospiraceae bacterium]|nr:polyprenyl synthetase family protein [Lachnospiraceae bacterium]
MSNFDTSMKEKVKEIEKIIDSFLPQECGYQKVVIQAMNYSVQAGGKRLRPMLMNETYRLFGGRGEEIKPFMAAMEMIHTYSLVHDDLPAMDNDEYRRGRKTTHVVYGEANAILAGDALLNYAFETAIKAFEIAEDFEPEKVNAMKEVSVARSLQVLARKAGIFGMIGGQTADIQAEEKECVSLEELVFIHKHKTAALIEASMMIGAILAGASLNEVRKIERCAYNVGLAFQIQDDILDVTGTQEELGKPIGSDEKNNKQTYVTLKGLEESRKEVERLSQEAVEILQEIPGDSSFLTELIHSLIYRTK